MGGYTTVEVTRNSDTQVTIRFTGTSSDHGDVNDGQFHFEFTDEAFVSNNKVGIKNFYTSINVNFND